MMINFERDNHRFNYRIAGIAVRDNRVLLHRAEDEDFWTCPGGRGELGETAEQTLIREMKEEIDAEVEVVRLLWLVENFFAYEGRRCHEVALYFLMRVSDECRRILRSDSFLGEEPGVKLIYQWYPIDAGVLSSLPLLPSFLQTALQDLPQSVQHVIHYDG